MVAINSSERGSATEIARRIRSRETTSMEVVRESLERIRALNPRLNAVVELLEAEALEQAREADRAVSDGKPLGPLHGVPVLIKDVHRVRGSLSTYGLPQFRNYRPVSDSWIADRMRQAGAVILGRTNVPVAGLDWQCWNPIYGRTVNPWDPSRTPGGSSGGAAAAVAAGFVPLDIGSDIAGSIRYPAHCCGVLGLRPTDGLVPNWRLQPEGQRAPFRQLLTSGPIARTFEDLELGLRALVGPGWGPVAKVDASPGDAAPLRIGWADSLPGLEILPLSRETRQIFSRFLERLREGPGGQPGFQVEKAVPEGVDFREALDLWGRIAGFEFTAGLPAFLRPRLMRALFFGPFATHAVIGAGRLSDGFNRGLISGPQGYFSALTRRDELQMDFHRIFDRYDLWITPSSPSEAIPHQKVGRKIELEGKRYRYSDYLAGWLCPFTTFGHPILSLPIGRTASGMPISVQVHGARFSDLLLLSRGRALSHACERPGKVPDLHPLGG